MSFWANTSMMLCLLCHINLAVAFFNDCNKITNLSHWKSVKCAFAHGTTGLLCEHIRLWYYVCDLGRSFSSKKKALNYKAGLVYLRHLCVLTSLTPTVATKWAHRGGLITWKVKPGFPKSSFVGCSLPLQIMTSLLAAVKIISNSLRCFSRRQLGF